MVKAVCLLKMRSSSTPGLKHSMPDALKGSTCQPVEHHRDRMPGKHGRACRKGEWPRLSKNRMPTWESPSNRNFATFTPTRPLLLRRQRRALPPLQRPPTCETSTRPKHKEPMFHQSLRLPAMITACFTVEFLRPCPGARWFCLRDQRASEPCTRRATLFLVPANTTFHMAAEEPRLL